MNNSQQKLKILIARKKAVEAMAEKAKSEARNDDYFDLTGEVRRLTREISDAVKNME